jgi:hypothetical protein
MTTPPDIPPPIEPRYIGTAAEAYSELRLLREQIESLRNRITLAALAGEGSDFRHLPALQRCLERDEDYAIVLVKRLPQLQLADFERKLREPLQPWEITLL